MSLLRMKGNHKHNLNVIQKKQELAVARCQLKNEFPSEDYEPCTECLQ